LVLSVVEDNDYRIGRMKTIRDLVDKDVTPYFKPRCLITDRSINSGL
ncbi:MAG: hypothetical protein K0Q73_7780, partial [Paenibacillus sp.]|nr:hypothetical protein [Paenibacillus sp.]